MPLKDLNDITVSTYQNNFQKYIDSISSEVTGELKDWLDSFSSHLPEHAHIFELGSATGRDARYLMSLGHKVICTDVIPEAIMKLHEDGLETAFYDFRDVPKESWHNTYDGYIADAVLLHAPQHIFEQALRYIHLMLKKGGVAMLVLKDGMGQEMTIDKMGAPRYFKYHNEESLRAAFGKMPFHILEITPSVPQKWIKIIVRAI